MDKIIEIINIMVSTDRFVFWLIGVSTLFSLGLGLYFTLKKPKLKIYGYFSDNITNGVNMILDSGFGCKEINIDYISGGKKATPTETKENDEGKKNKINIFQDHTKFQIPIGSVYNKGEIYYQLIILRYISKLLRNHKTKVFLLKIKCINDNNLTKGVYPSLNYYDNSHYKMKISRVCCCCKKLFNI